ncbi:hypothetical protein PIB30_037139 [Stylosanthes scabra]|uniref:Aminotransferase-like plant mobile domain-containing protein n=1 Tax=Stylosanthes scabra TaxID=79078 RepID=A0ABU6QD51_9FABA|nr:hypothetical protein [Stylosanthes scabra]
MSRCKTTACKPARNSRNEPPPPLSQLPLRKWFTTNEVWKSYVEGFSKLPVLKPRYLPEGLLPKDKYEVFWKVVDEQGLRPLLFMKERYYPRMMAVVATTLRLKDTLDEVGFGEFHLKFWIAGVKDIINLGELASLCGLPNDGIRFKGGSNPPKEFEHWDGEGSLDRLRISKISEGKYLVRGMDTDYCLLHYMLSYIWVPRKGNHGVLTKEHAFILRAMKEETKLNWPYLLAHRLMRYTDSSCEAFLGHGMLWTKIFEHFNLDLSGEEAVYITEENAITSGSLNKMGRGTVAVRKGRKNKAVAESASSQFGTNLDCQITPELMEVFAEKMHAFNIDWDKKMERVDKRLKVVESRIVSQAEELQSLEEGIIPTFLGMLSQESKER